MLESLAPGATSRKSSCRVELLDHSGESASFIFKTNFPPKVSAREVTSSPAAVTPRQTCRARKVSRFQRTCVFFSLLISAVFDRITSAQGSSCLSRDAFPGTSLCWFNKNEYRKSKAAPSRQRRDGANSHTMPAASHWNTDH